MERSKSFLRRKSVKRSAKSTTTRPSSNVSIDSQEEAWEALSRTSTTTTTSSTGSNNSKYSSGRRYLPSFDYQYHENPHFVTVTKPQSICVILSGTGIKLFECRLQDLEDGKLQKDTIISTTPIEIDGLACLSILLQSKQLVILSLPHLQPIAKTSLPENVCRLNEAMFTTEGRVLFWTGQYEMQEWMYLHSETSLPIGHSVDLFDDQKSMPPHPMETIQRPNKKTWFGAVAGAFKKGPLSIGELDTLMGRIHPGFDQNNQSKQQSPSRSGSSSTGIRKTGMFKELGDKVNERGERLDELGKKFSDMNDASGDFLKAVKDYNERQAQKKWWEF
ncbi:uncharacterized protein BX664DRAFT_255467 [Halteromyces radiatus]|uniref:uncharacterized protein n=1 Tax=Halteromyces radiatus TaxID=101107 RepID=UPI00221E902C|nr:uncharacterized protein BX664DRAFT_255467 [Halteromyces radiatus]KAI8098653.1 hypothetical protein BX664DRAFT_255467 [Halteromyces radiatus]